MFSYIKKYKIAKIEMKSSRYHNNNIYTILSGNGNRTFSEGEQ